MQAVLALTLKNPVLPHFGAASGFLSPINKISALRGINLIEQAAIGKVYALGRFPAAGNNVCN